jgi:hypothetical protein
MVEQAGASQKKEEDPLDTQAVAIKAFNKKVTEQVGNVVDQAVASPEPTNFSGLLGSLLEAFPGPDQRQVPTKEELLKDVTDLAATPIGTGKTAGPFTSFRQTGSFKRAEKTEPLGFDDALDLIQEQARQAEAAGKIGKQQLDTIAAAVDLAPKLRRELAGVEGFERDADGNLTEKGLAEQETVKVEAKGLAESGLKKEQLRKDLDMYQEIAQLIPTGDGANRFVVGVQNFAKGLHSKTPTGFAVGELSALNKRLRVSLVRAAGDVGNINIVEQKAAGELLFKLSDSTGLRKLKTAVLRDLTQAINSEDASAVKELISQFMQSEEFKKEVGFQDEGQIGRDKTTGKRFRIFFDGRVIPEGEPGFELKDKSSTQRESGTAAGRRR